MRVWSRCWHAHAMYCQSRPGAPAGSFPQFDTHPAVRNNTVDALNSALKSQTYGHDIKHYLLRRNSLGSSSQSTEQNGVAVLRYFVWLYRYNAPTLLYVYRYYKVSRLKVRRG